jgi:type I restriction enzyme S subunit
MDPFNRGLSMRLGDIINIKHGFAFSGNHIIEEDNGVVLVTPGNFRIGGGFQEKKCKFFDGEIPKEYILNEGDFIVTMTDLSKTIDTLGYSALVPKSSSRTYLHNQRIGLVQFKNDSCDRGYIYWLMRTRGYQRTIANTSTGSTVHHTSPAKICDFEFTPPSIETQRRIAEILSRYDSLIENYQRQIKLLEEAAQRLYKEWFVDLHFPGHETTPIIDGIPEGWEKKKIGSMISKVHRTKQVHTAEYKNSGRIPIIDQSKNYIAGYTDDNECSVELDVPAIIFGDHTRILKYVTFQFAKGADGTQLIVSNDLERMPQSLFFNSLLNVDLSNYSYARHFKYLKEEEIVVPTPSLANKYDEIVSVYYNMIQTHRDQIRNLTEARDRLLPKLMSGEIDIV